MLGANMISMSALSVYRNAVQFSMSIAMTAFIGPGEYGLVVFTLPFVTFIAMLTDFGLSSAITRSPDLTREQAGAAFTLMFVAGIAMAAVMAAAAVPLASAINMPGLDRIMAGMALVIVVTVSATTPRALLERQLRYGRIAAIEAIAVLVGAACGLFGAWHGAGAGALIIYNLINHSVRAVSFMWLSRQAMAVNFRWGRLQELISFGGWVLASNLLNFFARNGDNLLIGAWLGAAAVGIYGLAYQFMMVPLMAITWPASGILLASLRGRAANGNHAQKMIEGVISATAMITFPAMIFLTFGLTFPMAALLPPRWHGVPEIVAWLAPLSALQSIASYNGAVLLTAGRARLQFLFTILNTVVLLTTFVIALRFGLPTFVRAYVVSSSLLCFGFLALMLALTGLTWRGLLSTLTPALTATVAALATVAVTTGLHPASWPQWIATAGCYGAAVIATYWLFTRRLRSTLSILVARPA